MIINKAKIRVDGSHNPNWKGGLVDKVCVICSREYKVKRVHASSKYCSMKCVGISQKGKSRLISKNGSSENIIRKIAVKVCEVCSKEYIKPSAHAHRYYCCSKACSDIRRSKIMSDDANPNWKGGVSRIPYTWDFRRISKKIIERDSYKCQNPNCCGTDKRMTTHHINHDKQDNSPLNLIALCSVCNSKANFNRPFWVLLYGEIMQAKIKIAAELYPFRFVAAKPKAKKNGGGWEIEVFE